MLGLYGRRWIVGLSLGGLRPWSFHSCCRWHCRRDRYHVPPDGKGWWLHADCWMQSSASEDHPRTLGHGNWRTEADRGSDWTKTKLPFVRMIFDRGAIQIHGMDPSRIQMERGGLPLNIAVPALSDTRWDQGSSIVAGFAAGARRDSCATSPRPPD